MTPEEFVQKLVTYRGPCFRICAYCPEDFATAEVKECVEEMIKEIYQLRQSNDLLLEELVKIRAAYKIATGVDYEDS